MTPSLSSSLGVHIPRGLAKLLSATVAHQDRVEADGGVVSDTDLLDKTIRKLKSLNLYNTLAFGADVPLGVKESGGNIVKQYDFSDNNFDFTQATVAAQPIVASGVAGYDQDVADFDGADDQTGRADAVGMSPGDTDFWVSAVVQLEALDTGVIFSKWKPGTNEREFLLNYSSGDGVFKWFVSADGQASISSVLSSVSPVASDAFHIVAYHNQGVEIGMSVDGSTRVTTGHAGGCFEGTGALRMGNHASGANWNGLLGPILYGIGTFPSIADITELRDFYATHYGI